MLLSVLFLPQVSRFLAAASSSFEALPLSSLGLGLVLELFGLPQLMLEAPEMARVVGKARAKLLELYGDLEKVRQHYNSFPACYFILVEIVRNHPWFAPLTVLVAADAGGARDGWWARHGQSCLSCTVIWRKSEQIILYRYSPCYWITIVSEYPVRNVNLLRRGGN